MIRKIFLVFPFIWEQVLVFAACPVLLGSYTTETVGLGTSDLEFEVDPSADPELALVGIPQILGIKDWQRQNPKKPQISNVKPQWPCWAWAPPTSSSGWIPVLILSCPW